MTQVTIRGLPAEEIHIEIDKNELKRYGLTLQQVANIVNNNALEQSIGQMRTLQGDLVLTVDDRIYWAQEFAELPIITHSSGSRVTLGEIAKIKEGFTDSNEIFTQNGMPGISISIYRYR